MLSQRGFFTAIGGTASGGSRITRFVGSQAVKSFIDPKLMAGLESPISFQPPGGGRTAYGYPATVLVDLCTAVLEAKDAGKLRPNQAHIAHRADLLIRGLVTVGIIALVDEATGYQEIRAERALAEILERFIAKELQSWTRTFPYEFYEQIFRLKGWPGPHGTQRPIIIAKYTNDIVYQRLAPGVLDELKRKNPTLPRGGRRHKHHQWFTQDFGHPRLKEHLSGVIMLMKAASNWNRFKTSLDRAVPKLNTTIPIPFEDDDDGL